MWQKLQSAIHRQRTLTRQVRKRRHRLRHELLEDRRLLAGDAQIRYEFATPSGQSLSSLAVNQEFRLNVYVADIRANPQGIFSAFLDVNYPSNLATPTGAIMHGPAFGVSTSGTTSTPGLIDEVGGTDTDQVPPTPKSQENLLFSVPLRTTAAGMLTLTADPAENPAKGVVLFDGVSGISFSRIMFQGDSIPIVASGVQLSRTSGLMTTEEGGSDTFTAVLTSQPTANVSFTLSTTNANEGTVAPQTVTFTSANWNVPQTITVTGVNDSIDDDAVAYQITTSNTTSADQDYSNITVPDVSVTNADDNDTAGFVFSTTSVTTSESSSGGSANVSIRLTSQPTSNVTINLVSSNATEAEANPSSILFTPANWNVNQTVLIRGLDDLIVDGPINYTITTSVTVPSEGDVKYAALTPPVIMGINNDDDVVTEVRLSRTSGLVTNEAGASDTFTAVLSAPPTSNVTFNLSSSDSTEGTVSPLSVTFTPANWSLPQTITVTGVNDLADDDAVEYTIVTDNTISSDSRYNGLVVPVVGVTNQDDSDTAGYSIVPTGGLVTSENSTGNTATFTIRLNSQPAVDVAIDLVSSDTSEGRVSPSRFTFTPQNWDTDQTATVTGVDDDLVDGSVPYNIVTMVVTTDPKYSVRNPTDIGVTNNDNDVRSVILNKTSGLVITEAGSTDTFTARLSHQPTANVTLSLTSGNASEGTVSPALLTFTPQNWNVDQTVTVTGVDDSIDDGDRVFNIFTGATVSTDPGFNGLVVPDVGVTNTDNDTASIEVAPTSGLMTTEASGSDTFMVVLRSRPTADVVINIFTNDGDEVSIDRAQVIFTTQNWNTPQTVTVTGKSDDMIDGNSSFTILTASAISTDPIYSGINPADVTGVNIDGNSANVTLSPTVLTASEPNGTGTFTVRLSARPNANVTINVASNDTTEGTVTPSIVTLTPSNWNTGVAVTVNAVDDKVMDGDVMYMITTSNTASTDPVFQQLSVPDVTVTNRDDDVAGIEVDASLNLSTKELQQTATFRVRLTSEPTATVTIPFESSDLTEGTLAVASLTFTAQNWDIFQSVTVTGVNDSIDDGDVPYTIRIQGATSSDSNYSGRDAADVNLVNLDDSDAAGITVEAASSLSTSEDRTNPASFTIRLASQPTANVTIPIGSSDVTEGTASPESLIFTPENWDVPQTVTITGVDDATDDGDITYSINLGPATGNDTGYQGLNPVDLTIVNVDDDVPGFSISPTVGLTTSESATTSTFTVVLTQMPTADVSINLSSSQVQEGTIDNQDLMFTPANWNVPQTVTITGVSDSVVDGNQPYTIITSAAISADPFFAGINPPDVRVMNQDIDTAQITLVAPPAVVEGNTGTADAVVRIQLSGAVKGGFTLPVQTVDGTATVGGGDYESLSQSISFTGTTGEERTVTVRVAGDTIVELTESITVALGLLTNIPSEARDRITIVRPDATIAITDNDSAVVTLVQPMQLVEGNSGTKDAVFEVSLSAPVQGGFSVNYQTVNGTATAGEDYTTAAGTLNFSGTTTQTQTIRVPVLSDTVIEANETFQLQLGTLSGLVSGLESRVSIANSTGTATIVNDETATLSITGPSALPEGTGTSSTAFTFNVVLSAAVPGGFRVAYSTSDGTATVANSDYQSNIGTLDFVGTAGESRSITVNVSADDQVEPNETLSVNLGAITNIATGLIDQLQITNATATATITNDDFARLVLADLTTITQEGTSSDGFTDYSFTVTLTDTITDADGFEVPFTVNDGTATSAGSDYSDNDVVLRFDGTQQTRTVVVRVRQDNFVEGDESFSVRLGAITGLAAGETVQVPVTSLNATIRDDDTTTLTLATPQSSITEGDSGTSDFTFNVVLSNPVQGGFSIAYQTTSGTATVADNDFVDNDGTLTFTTQTSQPIVVRVSGDLKVEGNETFAVALGSLSGLAAGLENRITIVGSPVTATINDNDLATIRLSAPQPVAEGTNAGTTVLEFVVTLDRPVSVPLTVAYQTSDGTATIADNDYVDNDGTVTFSANSTTSQPLRVAVNRDSRIEEDETLRAQLLSVTGLPASLGDRVTLDTAAAIGTIINDDSAIIQFAASSVRVIESDGFIAIPVRLSITGGGALSHAITVNVSVRDDSSASMNDFTLVTPTVSFTTGSVNGDEQIVRVNFTQDGFNEVSETINLVLSLAGNPISVSLGSVSATELTVVDDPRDGSISGRVWIDTDGDGALDVGERTVPNVTIQLRGTTVGGDSIVRQLTTDINGFYRFENLSGGTYSITQTQPSELIDGVVSVGRVLGEARGTVSSNSINSITLGPSQHGRNYNFSESGMHAAEVNRFRILARPRVTHPLGNAISMEMLVAESATQSTQSVARAVTGHTAPNWSSNVDSAMDDTTDWLGN